MKNLYILILISVIWCLFANCKIQPEKSNIQKTTEIYFQALNNYDCKQALQVVTHNYSRIEGTTTIINSRKDLIPVMQWDSVFRATYSIVNQEFYEDDSALVTYAKTCKRIEYLHDTATIVEQIIYFKDDSIFHIHSIDYPNFNYEKWSSRRDTLVKWTENNHPEFSGFLNGMTANTAEKYLHAIDLYTHRNCRFTSKDGQKYYIKTQGKGDVTVIFENGMSDSLEVWGHIPEDVSEFAKVFLYDRADISISDTSRTPRTIPNSVSELHAILEQEQIKPPYVLVGHSLGGLLMRYFASVYPEEVKGMLLLDPAPEGYWNNMSKKELKKYIEGGYQWYHERFPKKYWGEWEQFIPNLAYMDSLNIRKDLPVIMISATSWQWYPLHKNILEGFENTQHFELVGEHHIFKQHPEKVVEYIKELVNL